MKFLNYSGPSALLMFVLTCFSCATSPKEADLVHLNGYWEIEEVIFPSGDTKEYTANLDIDFFSLEGEQGYRKKVKPKFNGSFETSDDAQPFSLDTTDGVLQLRYSNELTQWAETLVALKEDEMALKNEDGITYRYTRYEPLNLEN